MPGRQLTGYLFSDIEGSTDKWERDQDTMRARLERHDSILSALIGQHGGRVVDQSGDGVFAVFRSGNPLDCALAIQRAMQEEHWEGEPMRIRIGVHAGEIDPGAMDFRGVHANRAARVMALAWGDQTLLSDAAASTFPCPPGAALKNLGLHRLKGVPDLVSIFGLTHPQLQENEFPPLRSVSNEPRPMAGTETPFFGRQSELEALARLLAVDEPGLTTILGPGGYGKTRLAARVAELHGRNFPFGAHLVALESAANAEDVVILIAQALGFGFYGTNPEADQLLDYLRNKQGLLILDNAETISGHTGFIQKMVADCAKLKLLVTSRNPLGVTGEHVFRLGGLGGETTVAREIRASPAYQLFEYQARFGNAHFRMDDGEEPLFAELQTLVDGSPLALELAARTCRITSLANLVEQVKRSLDVLTDTHHPHPSRHRGIRGVFEYTWALLAPEERRFLANLSIFTSDFAVAAAEQVAHAPLPALRALEEKSLVKLKGLERVELHPLVRQYARNKLADSRERLAELEQRHAAYFLSLVPESVKDVCGEQRNEILRRLTQEFPNLQIAWEHQAGRGALGAMRPRIEPLFHVLRLGGLFREVIAWFSKGLGGPAEPGSLDALFLALIAACRIQQGDVDGATEAATRALEPGRTTDDLATAYTEHTLGNIAHAQGDFGAARLHYERALTGWHALEHELGAYFTTTSLAGLASQLRDQNGAAELVVASRRLAVRLHFASGIMATFLISGDIAKAQGRFAEALESYNRALALHDGVVDPQMRVLIMRRLGTLAAVGGDGRLSLLRHREAYALACEIGDRRLEAESLVDLGAGLLTAGDEGGAVAELCSALELARELGLKPVLTHSLVFLAVHKERTGDLAGARTIVASLEAPQLGDLGPDFAALGQRLGPATGVKPVALELLADDLIGDYRYGKLSS